MNIRFTLTLYTIIAILLVSCSTDDSVNTEEDNRIFINNTTLEYKHYKITATALDNGLFNLVRPEDEEDFFILYGGVNGFIPELGTNYTIAVAKYSVPNPPADAGSTEYDFLRIIEQSEGSSTETFDLRLLTQYSDVQDTFITSDSSSNYALLNDIAIDCNTVCEQLEPTLNEFETLYGTFSRNSDNSYKLLDTYIQ